MSGRGNRAAAVGAAALASLVLVASPARADAELALAAWADAALAHAAWAAAPPDDAHLRVESAVGLENFFAAYGYDLDEVKAGGAVPRLFVETLPGDLSRLSRTSRRKALFIRIALPLALAVNEAILLDRRRIEALRDARAAGQTPGPRDARWLAATFARYGVTPGDHAELLRRVDIVPPSLAIAQSVEESGWGTSRFAREANALFGQRIYRDGGNGVVPRRRAPGERFRIRRFARLMETVRGYAMNLNAHWAYGGFRAARAELRRRGRPIRGLALVHTLRLYSERREVYVRYLERLIRTNDLTALDGARLAGPAPGARG